MKVLLFTLCICATLPRDEALGNFIGKTQGMIKMKGLLAEEVAPEFIEEWQEDDDLNADPSSTSSTTSTTHKTRFSFEDIFNIRARGFSVRWISDSKYVKTVGGNITVVDLNLSKTTVLVQTSVLKSRNASSYYYWLSADKQWVLLTVIGAKTWFSVSILADYVAYNVQTGEFVEIQPPDKTKKVQLAFWGNTGNSLAFIQNNNIYYMRNVKDQPRQITFNGKEDKIINGITDWINPENGYFSNRAMSFSPDDSFLEFTEFNITEVRRFSYILYGKYSQAYPEVKTDPYTTPGYPLPKIKVKVIDLRNVKSTARVLHPPTEFTSKDHFTFNSVWKDSNILLVDWINRIQNVCIVMVYNMRTATHYQNQRQAVTNGWVGPVTYLGKSKFSKDGSYYIAARPFEQGNAGKFVHLAKISMGQNGQITQLTRGEWEVRSIRAFNKEKEIVYFESTESSPRELHLYSYNLKTNTKTCVSCGTTWARSSRCKYFSYASFSTEATWYILHCHGPGVPLHSMHNTVTNKVVVEESNQNVMNKWLKMMAPQRYPFQFQSGGYTFDGLEVRPPDFNPHKKYAVLFDVYGGPDSQQVIERFDISHLGWNAYLVSNYDIIIVRIDGRGLGGRGERLKHKVYLKLGEYEAEDTINAGRYMQTKPYVDKNKLAIWGWSFGGFLTTYVLSKNTGVFKAGIATAPVTDWRNYDSGYTEQYMGQLKDNIQGYNLTSMLTKASQFRNVSYLLVHGSGDDTVRYQHTAQMVKALTKEGIDFRVQYYTDEDHFLNGAQRHLYQLFTNFLSSKLCITKRI